MFGFLSSFAKQLRDFPPLFFRLILAYGFYAPALKKVQDVGAFAKQLGGWNFPLPELNAYLAAGTEALGVVLLALGLGTRLISIPLMVVMLVAIFVVHWPNGFPHSAGGFQIPLYFLLMLFSLFVTGAGRFSLDRKFFEKR